MSKGAQSRYHRQELLPGVGVEGQRRLGASHALILGCGALGCGVADQLTRAGVGRITLIDRDVVELTNLQRQVLFDEQDAAEGLPKAEAARRRLNEINAQVRVIAHVADFDASNAERLCGFTIDDGPDVLLDGTDNFAARLLLNDLAIKHAVPYVYAGVVGCRGMQMTVFPGGRPCLRCLIERPPAPGTLPTCDTAGVLGAVVAIVAGVQAAEALKLMLGREDLASRSLLEFDIWRNERRRIEMSSAGDGCACCGRRQFDYLDGRLGATSARLCGRDAVQLAGTGAEGPVDLEALAARLRPHGEATVNRFLLRATLSCEAGDDGGEVGLTVFRDGRTIVRGTTRAERARSLCAKYLGG
ncbi:MAG: ThiF family adenylyltransferase [Planctomycetes bacterium]|nr:ThiF family adenylyltransferase [Planctomycetota bacterium]